MRQLLFILCLFVSQANAQQINWVKQSFNQVKNLGEGIPQTWVLPNGSFMYFNNYGTSAQTDTGDVVHGAEERNAVVSFIDANGVKLHEFIMEGIQPSGQGDFYDFKTFLSCLLNDSEMVFLAPAQNVFINGAKRVDRSVFNGTNPCLRLYKLSNTGNLTSIITLPIKANGHVSNGSNLIFSASRNIPTTLSVDANAQRAFVSFSCSEADTNVFDTNFVKPNTTTVFQVNLITGAIDKHWTFPVEFDGVSVLADDIILSGRSKGNNYTYSINGSTYSRDSSADLTTADIVIASFNTETNTYNWLKQFKIRSPYQRTDWVSPYSIDQTVYLNIRFQDTVTIDGVQYGKLIPFNTQEFEMIMAIDENGVKWVNDIQGGHVSSVYKATHQATGVSCSIEATNTLSVNGNALSKTTPLGPNFLAFNEDGGVDRSFNAAFSAVKNMATIFAVDYADSILIVGHSLTDTDSLLLGGKYYTKKRKGGGYGEDLLYSFKSSAGEVPTGLNKLRPTSLSKVQVYPNPAQTQLSITGMEGSENVNVCIYDMMGKQLLSKKQLASEWIDISALSAGAYIVQLYSNATTQTLKLIVD